jgi:hypothetical protein
MDDIERLIDVLVKVLKQTDPKRVRTPFQVSELYQSIIPYRQYKTQLEFDTNQDYEMAVLRLLAGEGDYVSVEPPEVQQQLAEEVQAVNPNPGLVREFAAARVLLQPKATQSVARTTEAYAPRQARAEAPQTPQGYPPPPPPAPPAKTARPIFEAVEEPKPERTAPSGDQAAKQTASVSVGCPACSEALPQGRTITFCPFCGERVGVTQCNGCGDAIEPDWHFCVTCGTSAGKG